MQRTRPQLRPDLYGNDGQKTTLDPGIHIPTTANPVGSSSATQFPIGLTRSHYKSGKPEFSINCTFGMVSFYDIVVVLLSEFIGTFILMFCGCSGMEYLTITIPIAIATATIIFGEISGGHINPAVTIAAVITGQIRNIMLVPFYFIGQFAGGFAGYAIYHTIIIKHYNLYMHEVETGREKSDLDALPMCGTLTALNDGRGFGFEFLMSIFYIMAICALWDCKSMGIASNASISVKRALVYFGMTLCTAPFLMETNNPFDSFFHRAPTMVSLNSIRSLVPMAYNEITTDLWSNHWIYWVGPNLGALLGATIYVILKWCHRQSEDD